MLRIIKRNVENELKKQFKGRVKTSLIEDTLTIDIRVNGTFFHTARPNICGLINRGVTSHTLALDIGSEYMAYILEKFLK